MSYALLLFKQVRISLMKAARLANKNIYVFMNKCKKNKIPVIDFSEEEFEKELAIVNRLV
ncbi:MAG TPA: UPF0175 family protein [Leptospiraceae bacterium]|nr:UPF0175 family protein [Leptospiraceae bacterium]